MSGESAARRVIRSGSGAVVRPQAISDKTYVESVVSFLHDVVPQAVTGTPRQDDRERVLWVKYEEADYNDVTLRQPDTCADEAPVPLLLILGYVNGFQVWSIPSTGDAQEVLSLRQGPVRLVHMLKTPLPGSKTKDEFAAARPLFAVCDAASPSLPFSTVNLWSMSTGEEVHAIAFKSEVFDVLCNRRLLVVALQEKIAAFDACTLKSCFCITSCFPAPSPNLNPLALGSRWLAYADRTLVPSQQCCGGVSGDNLQSYTATVISAAKTLTKGLSMFGETVGRWTGADSVGDHGKQGSGKSSLVPGIVTVIDTMGIGSGEFCVQEDDHEGKGIVAHFPAHAGQPLSAMEFDPSGSLLVTADVLGHNFHVFHIMPHPACPSLGAVHHLYTLHRGETTATVHSITFTLDSRWVSVSTLRGTVHVFPITPYGGAITVRTHGSPRVVNRSSRFHTSAGLDDMERGVVIPSGTGRHSPGNVTSQSSSGSPGDGSLTSGGSGALFRDNMATSGISNNGLANARLPPLPHPLILCPFAQIRTPLGPRCSGPCCSSTAQSSTKSNGRVSATEAVGAVAKFSPSRGWLGGGPTQTRTEPVRSATDSLFILELHGNLVEYVLEPYPLKSTPQSDDTPLGLTTSPRARWNLGRSCHWVEIKGPLPKEHAILVASREASTRGFPADPSQGGASLASEQCLVPNSPAPALKQAPVSGGVDDQWLSKIEMETHAAPHRRLWMGPQFSFKTFQPPGSSSSLNGPSLGDPKSAGPGGGATITPHRDGHPTDLYTEELDLQSLRLQPVRSDPMPTPKGATASRPHAGGYVSPSSGSSGGSVPLMVDNGPGSLPDVWPGLTNGALDESRDDQLVETIAEAMNDNSTAPVKAGKKSASGEQLEFHSDSCAGRAVSAFASCTPPEMHPLFPPNGSPDWS